MSQNTDMFRHEIWTTKEEQTESVLFLDSITSFPVSFQNSKKADGENTYSPKHLSSFHMTFSTYSLPDLEVGYLKTIIFLKHVSDLNAFIFESYLIQKSIW